MERQKIIDELAEIQKSASKNILEILGSEKVLKTLPSSQRIERSPKRLWRRSPNTELSKTPATSIWKILSRWKTLSLTVSRGGYLKRTSVDTYRRKTRGGKGRIGMITRSEDAVEHLVIASTHAYMLLFTNKGRMYGLKLYDSDAGTTGKGKHISGLISLQPDEEVKAFLAVKEFVPDKFIVMVTRQGVIKKCDLEVFNNPLSRGIIALALDEGDELLGAAVTTGKNWIFLGSHEGNAIRFSEDEVRAMGRQARGVRAMDLEDDDYLVGLLVVEEEGLILSISEHGYGKRTLLTDYRLTLAAAKASSI